MPGRLPNKQSHVQVNQAHESCEKNCFTDVKTTQTSSNDSHKILVQRLQKWVQGWGPSLFNQKKSKYLQQFDSQGLPEDYQVGNGFLTKLQKQVPLFKRPKSRENIPDKRFPNCKSKKGFFRLCCIFDIKKELLNCQRSHLKPPSRDLSRTVYTAET